MKTRLVIPFLLLSSLLNCTPPSEKNPGAGNSEKSVKGVSVSPFGTMKDSTKVSLYTMTNSNGVTMKVMNYGGIIVSLEVPDRDRKMVDVVLGYDSLSAYEKRNPFFGALVGRFGNRIAQ